MATQPETHHCEPTLTDTQMLEFCRTGYIYLKGVVDDETNQRTMERCEGDEHYEPTGILEEDWFIENVILNPAAAGAVRCLLGRNFHLPILMSNHRTIGTVDGLDGWHVDGNSRFSPEVNYLQVFYYPQDTPREMGPTEVLPGSHVIHNRARFMSHLNAIRGSVPLESPAGTIFITDYAIWHRRGRKTKKDVRNMLKYCYWRTEPPERDWNVESDFDFARADYGSTLSPHMEQFRTHAKVAERFLWLCGKHEAYHNLGGQSWPLPGHRNDLPYGYPEDLPLNLGLSSPHEVRMQSESSS